MKPLKILNFWEHRKELPEQYVDWEQYYKKYCEPYLKVQVTLLK